jgi:hypothetical protein
MTRRLGFSLAFATLLHAGLFLVATRIPTSSAEAGPLAPIAVELEFEAPPVAKEVETDRREGEEPKGHSAGVNARTDRGSGSRAEASAVAPHDAPSSESGPPAGAEPKSAEAPWKTSPWLLERPVDVGLGAEWRVVPRAAAGALAPAEEKPRGGGGGGLRDALAAHDRAIGLGSGGPVLAVARDVAFAATVDESAATIAVDADATGHVTSARVVSATSDTGGWSEVATAIVKAMRGRTLKVPPDARGIVVSVRLEVALRLPSGARAGHPVEAGFVPGAFSMSFDVADVGARPKRTVSGQIVDERPL